MNKTVIALSLTTLFASSAMAATAEFEYFNVRDAQNHINKLEEQGKLVISDDQNVTIVDIEKGEYATIERNSDHYIITDVKGNITEVKTNANGDITHYRKHDEKIDRKEWESAHKNVKIDGDLPDINDEKRPSERNNDQNNHKIERIDTIAGEVSKAVESGHVVNIGDIEVNRANAKEMAEIYNNLTEEQKKDLSDYANNAKIDVKKDGVEPRPEPETPSVDDAKDYVDTRISGAAGQIYKDGAQAYSDLDNRIASNTARIDTLEQDMKAMGNKMLDLEDRMDGVVATSHAITNARPMVQNEGEFALGFGMGAAGSKQALAFGGAYQFNQSWSASTTVNYETAGKRSTSQISAGAGVHYKFK